MASFDKKFDVIQSAPTQSRRSFLFGAAAFVVGGIGWWYVRIHAPRQADISAASQADLPRTVTIVELTDDGVRTGKVTLDRIVKTDEEWQRQLTRDEYEITRRAGTERPYTNENPNNHAPGVFRCVCCATALYNANTKFESGTGWPSFWEPIAKENVLETTDSSFGVERTAVACRLCNAHLGHVFNDGPDPTGLRYCMNALAMRFAKATTPAAAG